MRIWCAHIIFSRCTDGTLLLRWVHLTRLRPEVDDSDYYYYYYYYYY